MRRRVLHGWSELEKYFFMNESELEKLYEFEKLYWWHVGRRDIIRTLLKSVLTGKKNNILEVGCGTGGNIETLRDFGKVFGLDSSGRALDFCKEKGFEGLFLGQAEGTDLPANSFDLVAAFDVLEHIDEEEFAIEESFRILKPG